MISLIVSRIHGVVNKKSSANIQLDSLDGLRGFAVLLVVIAHAGYTGLTPGFDFRGGGSVGVYLFFVLSSFLLSLPFVIKNPKLLSKSVWGNYLFRRLFRIFPMYLLIVLTFYFVSLSGFLGENATLYFDGADLIRHILLLDGKAYLWTIQVETKFYMLLPVFILLYAYIFRKGLLPTAIFSALVIGCISYMSGPADNLRTILLQIPVFLCGCMAAVIYGKYPSSVKLGKKVKLLAGGGALVLFFSGIALVPGVSVVFFGEGFNQGMIQYPVFYGLLWSLCMLGMIYSNGILSNVMSWPLLRYTGVISFSIYIWHVPLLAVIKRLPVELGWPFFIVLIAAVYIVSTLTYLLVEQPFLRMRLESITQGVWLSKKTLENKKKPTDDSE
jgi:peptidoglycan/LPS O-acetylase OafA/YrhL